jgi:SEC-C motif-containing protein
MTSRTSGLAPAKTRKAIDVAASLACPCGKGVSYFACCARWHAGLQHLQAPDAETLMRSRYSAFVLNDLAYLLATWHPTTRPTDCTSGPPGLKWLGLTVQQHTIQGPTHATVSFVARSRLHGRTYRQEETSRFVQENGQWFYVDGDIANKP